MRIYVDKHSIELFIYETLNQLENLESFYYSKSLFLIESSTLIRFPKIKQLLSNLLEKKFDKVFENLLIIKDLEEDIKELIAQNVLEIEFFSIMESYMFLKTNINDNDLLKQLLFYINTQVFQRRKKYLDFFSLNKEFINKIDPENSEIFNDIKSKKLEAYNHITKLLINNGIIANTIFEANRDCMFSDILLKFIDSFQFENQNQIDSNIFKQILMKYQILLKSVNDIQMDQMEDMRLKTLDEGFDNLVKSKEFKDLNISKNEISYKNITNTFNNANISFFSNEISPKNHCSQLNQYEHNIDNFQLKLKYFNKIKSYFKKSREKKKIKIFLAEKEKMSIYFYRNLLKSKTFYVLSKIKRSKSLFRIISSNYQNLNNFLLRKTFLDITINCYNKKRLSNIFTKVKNKELVSKVYGAMKNRINFIIRNKNLYLIQLSNNKYSVKFLIMIMNIIYNQNDNSFNKIRKRKFLEKNIDTLILRSILNKKSEIFDVIKGNYEKAKLKNQLDKKLLVQSIENKILHNKKKFMAYFKNNIKSIKFKKNLFFIRFYIKKIGKEKEKKKFLYYQDKFTLNSKILQYKCFFRNLKLQLSVSNKIDTIKPYLNKKLLILVFKKFKEFNDLKNLNQIYEIKKKFRIQKKFIRSLKKGNIHKMIYQVIEHKNTLNIRKNMLSSMIEFSFYNKKIKVKSLEYYKEFFSRIFTRMRVKKKRIENMEYNPKRYEFNFRKFNFNVFFSRCVQTDYQKKIKLLKIQEFKKVFINSSFILKIKEICNNKRIEKILRHKYNSYLLKKFIETSKICLKTNEITRHIDLIYLSKKKKKIFIEIKKLYINKLKFKLIQDKFRTFLTSLFTQRILEVYIKKLEQI